MFEWSVRRSIYKFCLTVSLSTLVLYLITLVTVSYVGVYLTYVALPVIVVFGLLAFWLEPKQEECGTEVGKSELERLREIEKQLEELSK